MKALITQEFKIPCHYPANGQLIFLETPQKVPVRMSHRLWRTRNSEIERAAQIVSSLPSHLVGEEGRYEWQQKSIQARLSALSIGGYLIWTKEDVETGRPPLLTDFEGAKSQLSSITNVTFETLMPVTKPNAIFTMEDAIIRLQVIIIALVHPEVPVEVVDDRIAIRSLSIKIREPGESPILILSWNSSDDPLAKAVIAHLQSLF